MRSWRGWRTIGRKAPSTWWATWKKRGITNRGEEADMRLTVTTPLAIIIEAKDVEHLRAEDKTGAFGILPGHADFLTALAVSVATWRDEKARASHRCAGRNAASPRRPDNNHRDEGGHCQRRSSSSGSRSTRGLSAPKRGRAGSADGCAKTIHRGNKANLPFSEVRAAAIGTWRSGDTLLRWS